MRRQRIAPLFLVFVATLLACSDDEPSDIPTGGQGAGAAGAGGAGSGGLGGNGGGGEIPDTECVDTAASAIEVYPSGSAPAVDALSAVGTRLVASGDDGIVFFDGDGSNADGSPRVLRDSRHVVASEGDAVAVAAYDPSWLSVQRFDEAGESLTALSGVGQDVPQVTAIAAAPWGTPVLWAYNTRLYGRTFTPQNTMSSVFDVAVGAYRTFIFLAAGHRGEEIGVVWSGDSTLGANQSFFTRVTSSGPSGERGVIYETAGVHNVQQVVGTDEGYMVLFTGEPPEFRPLVLRLGPDGSPLGEPTTLAGAAFAQGLASRGDSVAVVAGRASGELQMRSFGLDLAPRGPWVCLGSDFDAIWPAAITASGAGYAVTHTSAAGALVLHQTDDSGEGTQ